MDSLNPILNPALLSYQNAAENLLHFVALFALSKINQQIPLKLYEVHNKKSICINTLILLVITTLERQFTSAYPIWNQQLPNGFLIHNVRWWKGKSCTY